MLQLQTICFFGKPEISLTKLSEHALITATRLSELTFPSSKSHMVWGRTSRPAAPFFNVAELIFHAHNNFYILSQQTSDITFTSAASPDLRLHTDVTSMRLTDLYHGEPNRFGALCEKEKTRFVFKVPSKFPTVDA